jgi:hypothetical protein
MFIPKVFSLFFVCLLAACGNSVSHTADSNQKLPMINPDLFLRMERSQCLGNCPVYNLEVSQSGQVSFESFSFSEKDFGMTKSTGKIKSTLSAEKINELISEIDNADFFSLSADLGESGNCATDHSKVILSIRLRGKEKKITHDLGCSGTGDLKKLENLENKIDEIVETKRWIGERK